MRLPLLRLITQQQNALFKRKKRHSFAYLGSVGAKSSIHHCRMFVTLLPRSRRQPRRLFCATQEQMVSNDTHSLRVLFTILVIQNTYVPFFLLYLFIRCICFIFLQKYRKRVKNIYSGNLNRQSIRKISSHAIIKKGRIEYRSCLYNSH